LFSSYTKVLVLRKALTPFEGLHGRPYIPWDGVNAGPGLPGYPGFCHHVSNLLLSWHRPYLALYEQVLYQHILEAVNEFSDGELRQRYATAASTWRVPYWDWAAPPQNGQSVYPSILAAPTVQVTTPTGDAEIPNPLFSYKFHPVSVEDFYWPPVRQALNAKHTLR
jgi:tyrosinase